MRRVVMVLNLSITEADDFADIIDGAREVGAWASELCELLDGAVEGEDGADVSISYTSIPNTVGEMVSNVIDAKANEIVAAVAVVEASAEPTSGKWSLADVGVTPQH